MVLNILSPGVAKARTYQLRGIVEDLEATELGRYLVELPTRIQARAITEVLSGSLAVPRRSPLDIMITIVVMDPRKCMGRV